MSPDRRPQPRWTLAVLVALLIVPAAAANVALAATLGIAATLWVARRVAAARSAVRLTGGAAESGVRLGTDTGGRAVILAEGQLSAHGLILGASGAGKSTTLLSILADRIARGQPVVAIDLKGAPDFAAAVAEAASAAGRPLLVWTPDGPTRWNPLAHGNPTELKDKLIATERFTEPHYQRAAERYVQTVFQVLAELRRTAGAPPTLAEVVQLMDPRRLGASLRGLAPERAQRVYGYLAGLTPDQHSAIRGLESRLAIISDSHTGRFLGGGGGAAEVDLTRALAGEPVVLFSLNSSVYGRLSAQLGALVLQDLIAATGHRLGRRDPAQAVVAIDEFSALGADHVLALLARGRGSGVTVLLATQELADLDRAAPGLRDQVLGNTAVKIAHRQDVPSSAQTIAQMAGTETVWEETRQVGSGLLGRYDTGRGTRRQTEQFIVHPNEIKTLRTGEAVVITKLPRAQARTVRIAPPPARERSPEHGRDGPELG